MSNPARAKGTLAETAVATFLSERWPEVERRALWGSTDKGDLVNVPGPTVVEVKNHAVYDIPAWLREAEIERINAGAAFGTVVVKPRNLGLTKVGRWWVIQELANWTELLGRAVAAV